MLVVTPRHATLQDWYVSITCATAAMLRAVSFAFTSQCTLECAVHECTHAFATIANTVALRIYIDCPLQVTALAAAHSWLSFQSVFMA